MEKTTIQLETQRVCEALAKEGWVSYEQLREGLEDTLNLDKAITILKTSMNEITETTAGTPKKQGLQLTGKKLTKKRITEFLKDTFGSAPTKREKPWKDWRDVTMTIRFRTPCLAAMPREDGTKEEKRQMLFDRNAGGDIIFRSGHWRGLLGKAIEFLDDFPKYGKDKIMFDPHPVIINGQMTKQTRICPKGTGFTYHEALAEGAEITVDVAIPTSRITVEDFANMMVKAGKFVGFSIAGSNQGFGRFEVVGVEVNG